MIIKIALILPNWQDDYIYFLTDSYEEYVFTEEGEIKLKKYPSLEEWEKSLREAVRPTYSFDIKCRVIPKTMKQLNILIKHRLPELLL